MLPAFLFLGHCAMPITTTHDPRIQGAAAEIQLLEVPFRHQKNWTGCGAAVLASVLSYWGHGVQPGDILEQFPAAVPGKGYTLGQLKKISHSYQFHAFAFQSDIETLDTHLSAGRPLIVPLQMPPPLPMLPNYDHYVIIVGLDRRRGRIYLMDPQVGIHHRSLVEFTKQWRAKSSATLLVAP